MPRPRCVGVAGRRHQDHVRLVRARCRRTRRRASPSCRPACARRELEGKRGDAHDAQARRRQRISRAIGTRARTAIRSPMPTRRCVGERLVDHHLVQSRSGSRPAQHGPRLRPVAARRPGAAGPTGVWPPSLGRGRACSGRTSARHRRSGWRAPRAPPAARAIARHALERPCDAAPPGAVRRWP